MAEVFGPIGFAFGAIGFIFSTAGTVTEAWDNFHHYEEQMGLYQVRLGNLERKSNKWNILWKDVNFRGQSSAQMNGIKGRIHDLLVDIEQELRSHQLTDKGFWNTLRKGKRVKLKDISRGTMSIPRGLAHALWKNKKLERWMSRLQKEIEAIDTLSKDEFQERTAGFANKDPDETEVSRTMRLETFIQKLQSFAQKLHEQCTSTPTTKAWALGVRPPQRSKDSAEEIKGSARDINSWRDIAQVNIELVYTLEGEKIREGRLQLSHHRNHAQSPMLSPEIIKGEAAINDARIKRNILDEPRVRTRPIGKLIHDGFFQDIEINKAWQQDCARLIHGISNWNLFLWNTNWTQELCCYGLQIEQKVSAQDCFRQLFTAGLHEKPCVHHPWRLRNLGLVLAQLVLATPFRCTGDTGDAGDLELEEWNGEAWSSVYDVDILQRLLDRPNTEKIRDVIEFCMNDNSALAREPFKPGYILKCIDAIHDKCVELAPSFVGVRTDLILELPSGAIQSSVIQVSTKN